MPILRTLLVYLKNKYIKKKVNGYCYKIKGKAALDKLVRNKNNIGIEWVCTFKIGELCKILLFLKLKL